MLFYKEGDFSFIEDEHLKKAFTHDYKVIIDNNLQNYLKNDILYENSILYISRSNKYNWYPNHNNISIFLSLITIQKILIYGWDRYVLLNN